MSSFDPLSLKPGDVPALKLPFEIDIEFCMVNSCFERRMKALFAMAVLVGSAVRLVVSS